MTVAVSPKIETSKESAETSAKKALIIGIPQEIYAHECRVATTPDTAKKLLKLGFEVFIQAGAGEKANFPDELYEQVGCTIIPDAVTLWAQGDIILKVRPPQVTEVDLVREGQTLISFLYPAQNQELVEKLAQRQAIALAMDAIPRISRAQKMDALSSMANIAGYRAVIEAANSFDRFFTGQITAAGKIPPAKVLVIGAGVAGLAAIGAAKSLGAVVRAFDTRPAVKEQVESLGAHFLELQFEEDGSGEGGYAKVMSKEFIEAEMALFAQQAEEVDIIITTALIPGKKAPILITKEMVESMKEGSVIVDLAGEQGGNCELTQANQIYNHQGVNIVGYTDLPSRMASQSSQLYGTNLWHLLKDMGGNDNYQVNFDDEVVRGALITYHGEVTYPAPKPANPNPTPTSSSQNTQAKAQEEQESNKLASIVWLLITGVALAFIGLAAPASLLSHLTVFVLSCFVGWQLIWNVAPALHTPLMSVTNAISGIVIIGGILQLSTNVFASSTIFGAIAITVASINIVGGFMVTQRMLNKFRK